MAIPTNYIDKITKDGESRDICPAAGKVRVDNENFEGADLNEVLNEIFAAIEAAASGGYAPPVGGIPATDLAQAVQDILNDVANKVDKVPGKGLSTEDFTAALKAKLEALDPYSKQQVDNAISQMEATIEQQQLTVITGGKLSMWLDEDGESINIIAGDVPDFAVAPTISHSIMSDVNSADNGKATVTIQNNEQGATIFYTTDGSTPTQQSSQYTTPFVIATAGPHTINAIAVVLNTDKLQSSVATDTFSVVACSTPTISVNNTDRVNAVVTASAGSNESVSLTVGSQTATGTGSASVTIAKTSSPQSLSASASATAAGKLPASATQSVEVSAKEAYSFGAHEIGGKAASANEPITLITNNGEVASVYATTSVLFDEVDGEVYWHADLEGKTWNGLLQGKNEGASTGSIFSEGATNVLTIEHIPEEVTAFGGNAFRDAANVTLFKVAGNSSLTDISSSLAKLTSLETVILPASVTRISYACTSLSNLKSFSAPGVVSVQDNSFNTCSALTSVVFGQLTSIGPNAFFKCTALPFTGVDFTKVTSIGTGGLQKCNALGSITLKDITSIGQNAFAYYDASIEVIIDKEISSASEAPTLNSAAFTGTSTSRYSIKVPANSVSAYQEAWATFASNISAIPTE